MYVYSWALFYANISILLPLHRVTIAFYLLNAKLGLASPPDPASGKRYKKSYRYSYINTIN